MDLSKKFAAIIKVVVICLVLLGTIPVNHNAAWADAEVDFGPYMADLQRRIKRNWHPPIGNEERRVIVIFKIMRNGSVTRLRLDKPSQNLASDSAALEAVAHAAPVRPLPGGSPADVDIQFTFDFHTLYTGKVETQEKEIAKTSSDQHVKLARLYRDLGSAQATNGNKEKAQEAYEKAIDCCDKAYGKGSEAYATVMGAKARYLYLYGTAKDYAAATKVLNEAAKVVEQAKNADAAGDIDRLRAVLIEEPRRAFDEAEKFLKHAAQKAKEANNVSNYQDSQIQLADCYLLQDKIDEACGVLNSRIADAMMSDETQSKYVVPTARLLCNLYIHRKKDSSAALTLVDSIYTRWKSALGEKAPLTLQALDLCIAISEQAKSPKAKEYIKESDRLVEMGEYPNSQSLHSDKKEASASSTSGTSTAALASTSGKPPVAVLTPATKGKGKVDAIHCNNDGVKLLMDKKFPQAVAKFREALTIDPTYGLARENFAIAQNNWAVETVRQPDEAISHLRQSLYIRPQDKSTKSNLQEMCDSTSPGTDHLTFAVQCAAGGDYVGAIVEYRLALDAAESNKDEIQSKIDGLQELAKSQFDQQ